MAIGRLHISIQEFYKLSPIEFYHAINETAIQTRNEIQTQYEIARWQIIHHWNMQGRVLRETFNTPTEAIPFPWESEYNITPEQQSIDTMKRQMQAIAGTFNRKKK